MRITTRLPSTDAQPPMHRTIWRLRRARWRRELVRGPSLFSGRWVHVVMLGGNGVAWLLFATWLAVLVAGVFVVELLRAVPVPDRQFFGSAFLSTRLYAEDSHSLLYEIVDPQGGSRTLVPLHEVPRSLVAATVAAEDEWFFIHPGFDVRSIFRAVYQNLTAGQVVSGASTITQQLARNVIIAEEERYQVSYLRKLTELILAYRLTLVLERDEILERYLNEIYYGNLAYGIEAAAQGYFGKPARELTLAEATLLAGLPQAPSAYDPMRNLSRARDRQAYVLDQMVEQGYLTAEEVAEAWSEPLRFASTRFELRAPHFVYYVRDELVEIFGERSVTRDGLRVTTTLDLHLQDLAEDTLASARFDLHSAGANNATLVVLDVPTGGIRAMAGSLDYDDEAIAGQMNQAVIRRQSGPILLPLLLAAGFESGYTAFSILQDEPIDVADGEWIWIPRNPDGQYRGPVHLRTALHQSLLAPFSRMLRDYGGDDIAEFVRRAGVPSLKRQFTYDGDLLARQGDAPPLEIAAAYATIARGGLYRPVTGIETIEASDGGVLLDAYARTESRAVSPSAAYLTTHALAERFATTGILGQKIEGELPQPVAVHWGQTEDRRDTWVAGYTPELVIVLWVGNTNGQFTKGAPALETAARTWLSFTAAALRDRAPAEFTRPPDVVETPICLDSNCDEVVTATFVRGTEIRAQREVLARLPATPTAGSAANASTIPAGSVAVPQVRGMTPAEARGALEQAGLRVASVDRAFDRGGPSDRLPESLTVGTVVDTDPTFGAIVPRGTTIQLLVLAE